MGNADAGGCAGGWFAVLLGMLLGAFAGLLLAGPAGALFGAIVGAIWFFSRLLKASG